METRAVLASLGSLPHTRPCSVPAPCNQHPSRTFWLRGSEARPTGGRKAEGLSSVARNLYQEKLPLLRDGRRRQSGRDASWGGLPSTFTATCSRLRLTNWLVWFGSCTSSQACVGQSPPVVFTLPGPRRERPVSSWGGGKFAGASSSGPMLLFRDPAGLGSGGGGQGPHQPGISNVGLWLEREKDSPCRFPIPGPVHGGCDGAHYLQAGTFLKVWFCSKTQNF